MKIAVVNLGCKVNQYESDSLIKTLANMGHEVTDTLEYADLYILNTCAVTNEAERKSRQAVKRCKNYNNNARIIVCGCAAEDNAMQFAEKDNVTRVSGVAGKALIPQCIDELGVHVGELPLEYEDDFSPLSMRTRSYVKVQDGCNNFCSYCIIPYLRGRSRSRSIDSVVKECREVEGSHEIVITGINLSAYGKDTDSSLVELIDSLRDINARIRLGSLEVNVIDEALLESLSRLRMFCPQFHLSLQSGSNSVLKKMNRHYTKEEYLKRVELIRSYYPHAAITTDIICGFPTETIEEFEECLDFARTVDFADMHIFGYSRREGTRAAKLPDYPNSVKKEREYLLEEVHADSMDRYLRSFVGSEVELLVEEEVDGMFEGYTREYMRARMEGNAHQGEIVSCVVLGVEDKKLMVKRR